MGEGGRDRTTPQYHYNQHKQTAKQRCIPWEFANWQEWYAVWEASGKWEQRGCKKGQYVMSRHGDVGPYSPSNVFISEAGKNGSAALKDWGKKKKAREAEEARDNPVDVTFVDPVALQNAKQFWKEKIIPSTPQPKTIKKKISIKKEKELTFLPRMLLSIVNWFKHPHHAQRGP